MYNCLNSAYWLFSVPQPPLEVRMVPESRLNAVGFLVLLTLSRWWESLRYFVTSEHFKRRLVRLTIAFLLGYIVATAYTWASFECLLDPKHCFIASADWARWLWENIFSQPWWPK